MDLPRGQNSPAGLPPLLLHCFADTMTQTVRVLIRMAALTSFVLSHVIPRAVGVSRLPSCALLIALGILVFLCHYSIGTLVVGVCPHLPLIAAEGTSVFSTCRIPLHLFGGKAHPCTAGSRVSSKCFCVAVSVSHGRDPPFSWIPLRGNCVSLCVLDSVEGPYECAFAFH